MDSEPSGLNRARPYFTPTLRSASQHILIVVAAIVVFNLAYHINYSLVTEQAENWSKPLRTANVGLVQTLSTSSGTAEENHLLTEKYKFVLLAADWHLQRAADYLAIAEATVSTTELAAALAAIALFWISKNGFNSAAPISDIFCGLHRSGDIISERVRNRQTLRKRECTYNCL